MHQVLTPLEPEQRGIRLRLDFHADGRFFAPEWDRLPSVRCRDDPRHSLTLEIEI
ncbi:hypothetical protein [Phenylobacterium sp. SCN 70-31]|uniref:hypothetical protein n=1 Tax=Phenylobacterium sp. SCN 70-31 TaxID=1660129 RepID=UPI0025F2A68A|nr:hypothetical protein [Phenylobacterium sp. SCN 70-31]